MTQTLLQWMGIGSELAERADDLRLLVARPMFLVLALLVAAPLAWWVAARHRAIVPRSHRGVRWVLTTCRVAFVVLLLIVLADPYVQLSETVKHKPVLAVLVDQSASMDLLAGPFEDEARSTLAGVLQLPEAGDAAAKRRAVEAMSRAQVADGLFVAARRAWGEAVEERFDVRQYVIGRTARPVRWNGEAGRIEQDVQDVAAEESQATALGAAVERALLDAAGRPVAGVVLLTDGQSNWGPTPAEVVRRAQAAGGGELSAAPLFAVAVGSPQSPGADVAVVEALGPGRAMAKDTVAILATVASRGLDGRKVKVLLDDAKGNKLDEAEVELTASAPQQVTLRTEAGDAGTTVYAVRIDKQAEETVVENNRITTAVEVQGEPLKVLLLEGYPRWDFRFLDHELRRDRGLEATVVVESSLADAGGAMAELAAKLGVPSDVDGFAEFDAVVLGDISPELLPTDAQEALATAVRERGVGLLVQTGFTQMPHAFLGQPLVELLPLEEVAPRGEPKEPGQPGIGGVEAPVFAPFDMKLTPAGAIHPAFLVHDDAGANRRLWDQLPSMYWAAQWSRPRAGASVLAEVAGADDRWPLIVEQYAGRGRVLVVGTDATFLWRRNIGSLLFGRFWGQAIRYVARDEAAMGDVSRLTVHPARVEPGQTVSVELYAVTSGGAPATGERVDVEVKGPKGPSRLTLSASGTPGVYRGVWSSLDVGAHTLSYGEGEQAATAGVEVALSNRELARPEVDRAELRAAAVSSGGAMVEPADLLTLPQRLEGEPRDVSRVLEDDLWDNWLTLLLLATIYTVDVGVRRFWGLT